MNTLHYTLRVLLVFVCLFVLFLPIPIAHASEFDPTYYIVSSECSFMSATFPNGWEINWGAANYDNDFVNSEYGVGFSPGIHSGVIWQNLDRTLPAGTYNVQVKVKFVGLASTPEGFTFNKYSLRFRKNDEALLTEYFADSIDFLPAQGSNVAYYTINFKNITADTDFNRLSHLIYFTSTAVTNDGFADMKLEVSKVLIDEIDETPGLLKGIIGWIENIFNSIAELPNKLLDGIKGLFIPSEEDITNMQDKWTTLLSDRFGALYQVVEMIDSYAKTFTEQSKKTITFPSVTIPLGEADFVFGGWEVQVIPDGFDVLIEALKLITSIAATILFVNGLKNRFEKLVGGADDV